MGLTLEPDPCDIAAADRLDPEGVGAGLFPNEIVPETALAACQASVERVPGVGRFHYQLGRVQLAARDFEGARGSFERARDLGHTRAWVALGSLVATEDARSGGLDGGPVPAAALEFYQKGVEAGDPYAFHALGRELLRRGTRRGDPPARLPASPAGPRVRAHLLDERARRLRHEPRLARRRPAAGPQDTEESAARGDIYGYYNLGIVYRDGLAGVTADTAEAVEWFEKAAAGGHPAAPGTLGRLWNSGALGEEDRDRRAIDWYDQGLARCDGWSGANAAWIILNREPADFAPRDAAVRAAKAAVLSARDSAAEARGLLDSLDRAAIDGASQTLINALGGSVAVDGAFGPASATEMDKVLAAADVSAPTGTPTERLLALAQAYWLTHPCRVDLY